MTRPTRPRRPARLVMSAGVLLVLAAPTVWILSGAPGAPARVFGAPVSESLPANEASTETPSSGPSPTDASPDAAGPVAAEDAAPAVPPPFTTTAPRGAIDRSRWPVDLAIPSLGVTAPVQPVGVGTAGELIIPPSPMDVGWYQGGSMPGEPGVALLTSHIDTRSEGRGVLSGLVRLSEGDEVLVTAGDGVVQRWSVVARTQHRKDELPSELFARAGTSVLALVTCGGPFDPAVRSYRDNVIVWAELAT